jgi:hypothetical protein
MAGVGYSKRIKAPRWRFHQYLCVHNGFLWIGRRFHHGHGADDKMLQDTTLTLFGNQTIGPSVIGSLTKATTIGTNLNYIINSRSSLSFAASATRQITTSSSDFYSGSVTYSYQLAREWNSQLTYRHLHRTASRATSRDF